MAAKPVRSSASKKSSSSGKDYEAIARKYITTPTEKGETRKLPRILVYGRNKKGKTTFMSSAPNVLIIDPEEGTDELTKKNPKVWPVDSWEDLDNVYKYLKLGTHPYEWVALDGMTKIHNMALRWVMNQAEEQDLDRKPGLVQQRDYGRAGEMTKGLLWNFHNLPIGVIFSAQERVVQPEFADDADAEMEDAAAAYVPDLPAGARSTLNSIVGIIGRIYIVRGDFKVRNKKTGKVELREGTLQRRLWLEPNAAYDTGYRSEYELPPFIPNPTVPKLVNLIRTGSVKGV
jgi:hypothetical protein